MPTTADGYPWIDDPDLPADMLSWTEQAAAAAQQVLDIHEAATGTTRGTITPAAGWADYGGVYAIDVLRTGPLVVVTGLLKRTGTDLTLAAGATTPIGTIAAGFRPKLTKMVTAGWGISGLLFAKAMIDSAGAMSFTTAVAGTHPTNGYVIANWVYEGA